MVLLVLFCSSPLLAKRLPEHVAHGHGKFFVTYHTVTVLVSLLEQAVPNIVVSNGASHAAEQVIEIF